MRIIRLLLICVVFLLAGLAVNPQGQDAGVWKRVYTGDGYMIEVNIANLEFDVNRILRTQIRTILDKEEPLKDGSGAKSKTRLEKVEYQFQHNDYRVVQVVLL